MNPIEAELYRLGDGDRQLGTTFLDVFSRTVRPAKLLTARRFARLTARALVRGESDRGEVLRIAGRELRAGARHGLQRLRLRRRGSIAAGLMSAACRSNTFNAKGPRLRPF